MRTKVLRILKKLKNLPRGRQSMKSLLEEARAMRISYSLFAEDLVVRAHFRANLMSVRFIHSNNQTPCCSANWAGAELISIAIQQESLLSKNSVRKM
jgi:hypothetical protein